MKHAYWLLLLGFSSFLYSQNLNQKLKRFEIKNNLESALIIMNAVTGKIEFIHNKKSVISVPQPAGSLVKVFSAGTLLEHKRTFNFNSNKPHRCVGHFSMNREISAQAKRIYNLEDNRFQCSKSRGHGSLALSQAIQYSCNVFFLSSVYKQPEKFYDTLVTQWHLNRQLGALPGQLREQTFNPPIKTGWLAKTLSSIGEGYFIQVTPLKITQLYGSLFSGQPIMSAVYHGKGKPIAPIPVSNKTRSDLLFSMKLVISKGTLSHIKAKPKLKLIGGKTGSGTLVNKKFITNGWTVLGLRHKKKLLVLTSFTNRGTGSREAAEVAQIALDSL